ncbi:MAG: HEAT repeat domain-containing protein [Candidatus Thorarchaeota archaeon]|jgi:HEAT repeat protein
MSILELLAEPTAANRLRDIADHINSHPEEFSEALKKAFDDKAPSDVAALKQRFLDIVDYLPHKYSIPILEKSVNDADSRVRVRGLQAAYRTRVESLNSQVLKILENTNEEFEVRKWAVHILGSSDPRSYGEILRKLARNSSDDIRVRKEAVYALTKVLDDESIGALCALLGDSEVEIRRSGAWALSSMNSPESICCLLAALEDDDEGVRDWSIRALRDMDDSRALQGLSDAISRSDPKEQVRLVRLVVERRSEIILRVIAELLPSDDVNVRRVAAWAMGVSPYPPATASLRTLTSDEDEQVRDYAKTALIRLGEIDPSDLRL